MEKLKDLSKYLTTKGDVSYFNGEKMLVKIPRRYETYGLLDIGDTIKTLAIFGVEIDNKYSGAINVMVVTEMSYLDITEEIIDDVEYYVVELGMGDIFAKSSKFVKDSAIPYALFVEFLCFGRWPYFIDHDLSIGFFRKSTEQTGLNMPIDRITYEFMMAKLARDPKDVTKLFRHGDMKGEAKKLMLKSVALTPESTMSRSFGSYFEPAIRSSTIRQPSDDNSFQVENIFRV